jgi:glutamate:GABA antiporter
VIIAGLLISVFYIFATFGILVALPQGEIGLIDGLLDTVKSLLQGVPGAATITLVIGCAAIFTILANLVTWSMGANRTAHAAAVDGELPPVFAILRKSNQTPIGAYVLTGLVSTLVIVAYGFIAGTAEDLFWTLFAFSSIIFLLPYLILFPAFLRLRKIDGNRPRPYRVPGGKLVALGLATLCTLFILQAVVLFVWVPGEPVDWAKTGPIIIGVIITIMIGEWIIKRAARSPQALTHVD